ncbi:glycosyltransferase family 2 protein [Hydrogenophaga soli]
MGLSWVEWLGSAWLAVLSVPVAVFVAEILMALLPRRQSPVSGPQVPLQAYAVLVPAHNEGTHLRHTLQFLLATPDPMRRVLVVADNCTDDTAVVARSLGVEVVERHDPDRRGKGYALQFGVDHLKALAPATVVVIDADCTVSGTDVQRLAHESQHSATPVQGRYLMHARPGSPVGAKISEFAWLVKTSVRQSGLARMVGCCQLLGSGMAFPWAVLSQRSLATGHIVEDLKLTTELAHDGVFVRFMPSARVDSEFPTSDASRAQQSRRWEHGHLSMILSACPRLLVQALKTGDWRRAGLALDMLVPPLSLLVVLVMALGGVITALAWWFEPARWLAPWALGLGVLMGGAVLSAWASAGRQILTVRELWQIPRFIWAKLDIYRRFVRQREQDWKRADRE